MRFQICAPRSRTRWYQLIGALPAAAAALLLGAAGCGSATAPGTASSSSPPAARATLNITVTKVAGGTPRHWTLRCDPAGGTAPHAAAICRRLLAVKYPFAPLPQHEMCPMILASGDRMTITGRWYGKQVSEALMDGGCDLGRWNMIGPIFN